MAFMQDSYLVPSEAVGSDDIAVIAESVRLEMST